MNDVFYIDFVPKLTNNLFGVLVATSKGNTVCIIPTQRLLHSKQGKEGYWY